MSSIMNHQSDTLDFILTKFKDTIDINYKTPQNITALHVICFKKRNSLTEGCETFLHMKNLDVNAQANNSYTPIQLAAINKNYSIMSELLKNQNVDVNVRDENDNTLLHLMFMTSQNSPFSLQKSADFLDIIKVLIDRNVDILATNKAVFFFNSGLINFLNLTNYFCWI